MKPKVFATYYLKENLYNFLSEHCDVEMLEDESAVTRDELLPKLAEVDALLTDGGRPKWRVDDTLLDAAPNLKVVSNVSVGYNNFDVEAMDRRGVVGTNTPGVLDETVADIAFGLILSTARRISELDQFMKEGKWNNDTEYVDFYGKDVNGATLGIIGMGRIGEAIARRAKFGFNMDVLYYNRNRKPEAEEKYEATHCSFDELLETADFIVLMTPLTDETYHLIGKEEFKKMKKSAVFVNVSRGQTVDEKAMIEALENGEIYGAGLDVFDQEPIEPTNPLLKLSNVVLTPHIGSATTKTEDEMAMRAMENLIRVLQGKEALNPVGACKSV